RVPAHPDRRGWPSDRRRHGARRLPPPRRDARLTRIAVLADDLIWATRLTDLIRKAGAGPVPARAPDHLQRSLLEVDGVVVDLTARAYDGIEAIRVARTARRSVLAVGQTGDVEQRRGALEG